MKKILSMMVAALAIVVASNGGAQASFSISTGMGVGTTDPNYTYAIGNFGVAGFPVGLSAAVLNPVNPGYVTPPAGSRWIYANADGSPSPATVTFQRTITVLPTDLPGATITGFIAADNAAIIYLNGVQVGQTTNQAALGNGFSTLTPFTISSGILATNRLDIVVTDGGVVGGLLISATLNTVPPPSPAPVPATALLAGLGFPLLGLAGAARRRLFA